MLVSLNPYKSIARLKDTSLSDVMAGVSHPHTLAHRAYQALRRTRSSQMLVVSGESGAGKTEAIKLGAFIVIFRLKSVY